MNMTSSYPPFHVLTHTTDALEKHPDPTIYIWQRQREACSQAPVVLRRAAWAGHGVVLSWNSGNCPSASLASRRVSAACFICNGRSSLKWHLLHKAIVCSGLAHNGVHEQVCATVSTTIPCANMAGSPLRSMQRRGPGCVRCSPHCPVHWHCP